LPLPAGQTEKSLKNPPKKVCKNPPFSSDSLVQGGFFFTLKGLHLKTKGGLA
jgi:hypothetical protein